MVHADDKEALQSAVMHIKLRLQDDHGGGRYMTVSPNGLRQT